MNQNIYERLVQIVGSENVLVDESMKKHTTFRVGGVADFFVTPCSILSVGEVIGACKEMQVPYFVIGNGSNLLVSDAGYRGVVIQIYDKLNQITWEDNQVTVMAGALLSKVGKEAAARSLSGFEFATGIPGTMGGAVTMNAGAYGGEIKDCIVGATMLEQDGTIRWYDKDELELGYRMSVVVKKNLVVLDAKLQLEPGNQDAINAKLKELAEARRSKQPLEYPSAGSTFKRPEGYFAGKLIEDAGFKGYRHGGAMVSDKHSGFVINADNATAKDIIELIKIVQKGVFDKFGVNIEMEVKMLGEF